jgi:DNA mismatch repair protein MutL
VTAHHNRNPIRLLPEHLIDQIKAGEVIERPANVLKELLENALDAGATQIDIEIKDNGLTLLRVNDNGSGIPGDELATAFGRHATSKINRFEDLYRLSSFGFRGEALPSIASVSRLECVSWTEESSHGASLRFEGGQQGEVTSVEKSGKNFGTIMTVQDLFFNTPARLKFLQSATSEKNWLKKFFYAFALTYPTVTFSLLWDQDERLIYQATNNTVDRIRQFFSSKAQDRVRIHEAKREWQGLSCHVFAIFQQGTKAQGPLEHVIINQRPVLDKAYIRVSQQVLEKLNLPETPILLIKLDVPGDQIDVNVHPNKTMVKFHQMGEILSLVTATLREALPQTLSPTEKMPELSLPNQSNSIDLSRDRAESYAGHIQRMQTGEEFELSIGPRLLHSEKGPYFLWQLPQKEAPLYIDGRTLLATWIATQKGECSSRIPLLVSHPLRDAQISPQTISLLNHMGFEIDSLEAHFHVVREIPIWSQGLPLSVLMPLVLDLEIPPFDFHEISIHKWENIWNSLSDTTQESPQLSRPISPKMFGKNS